MTTKQKSIRKAFKQAMKWNGQSRNNPTISKTKPDITVGAFGQCKYLKNKEE